LAIPTEFPRGSKRRTGDYCFAITIGRRCSNAGHGLPGSALIRSLLVCVLVLCFVSPAGAQPAAPAPGVEVGPVHALQTSVRPGGNVTIVGQGCAPATDVRIDLYNPAPHLSGSFPARQNGQFAEVIQIPPDSRPGRAWLRSTCVTPNGTQRIGDAVVLVTRPALVVTWINIFFGLGAAFLVAGFGLVVRKSPSKGRTRRRSRRQAAP